MECLTILLTGGTGFIGSHLADAIISSGYKLVILKRSTSNLWRISHLKGKYKSYDLDKISIDLPFKEQNIDIVIHLATVYKKYEEPTDVADMIKGNVSFPCELLTQAERHHVKGFINTGTYFEYDCKQQPISEGANKNPFNFYAKTKISFENILQFSKRNMAINNFKLFTPYGEKDNNKLVKYIIKNAIQDKDIMLSEGLQKIDLIYVEDIVNAYIKAIRRLHKKNYKSEFEDFNIGSGVALSLRDIVSIIEEQLGRRVRVTWGQPSVGDAEVAYSCNKKAEEMLGWRVKYSVKCGIEKTIEYYRKNLDK